MKSDINRDSVSAMVERAKGIFLKKSDNDFEKKILVDMPYYIIISNNMYSNYAFAFFSRFHVDKNTVRRLNLSLRDKKIKVDSYMCYPIIQVNKSCLQKEPKALVYDVVSHELAHLLDGVINGYFYRTNSQFHMGEWKRLHKLMGGSGKELVESRISE